MLLRHVVGPGRAFRRTVYEDSQQFTPLPLSRSAAHPIHSPATNSTLHRSAQRAFRRSGATGGCGHISLCVGTAILLHGVLGK